MDNRLKEWAMKIEEAESGGMSIRDWCKVKGISESRYYYWRRQLRLHGMLPDNEGHHLCRSKTPEDRMGGSEFVEFDIPSEPDAFGCIDGDGLSFPDSRIMVQAGRFRVWIAEGFSADTLARVLEVVM